MLGSNQHVPDSPETLFSELKNEFISGKNSYNFALRLMEFLQVPLDELPAPQNQNPYCVTLFDQ
jgi:hypothetical protein